MTREHLSRGRIFRCGLAAVVLMVFLLAAGCSRSAAVEPGKEEVKRSYTKGQLMTNETDIRIFIQARSGRWRTRREEGISRTG